MEESVIIWNAEFLNRPHVFTSYRCLVCSSVALSRPVLYGLAVHFKIYPIYFVLAMLLYLDDSYDTDRGLRHVP